MRSNASVSSSLDQLVSLFNLPFDLSIARSDAIFYTVGIIVEIASPDRRLMNINVFLRGNGNENL